MHDLFQLRAYREAVIQRGNSVELLAKKQVKQYTYLNSSV